MKFSRRDFVKSMGTGAGALAALNASGCGSSSSAYSDAAPLWAADAVRNKIVVISDIHLGIEDRYTETLKNGSSRLSGEGGLDLQEEIG